MKLREASLGDVDAVVDVLVTARADDPGWTYRFQHRNEYPEAHRKFQRLFVQYLIDPSYEDWVVMVAESPSVEDAGVAKIVAVAVWDVSYVNKRKYGPCYQCKKPESAANEAGGSTRQDVNPVRVTAFREKATAGREKYFNHAYGSDQIYLLILATLPAYRRQGFGSALCKSGMSRARDDDVAVTLYASPMGFQLYSAIGFQHLGDVTVRVPGEEESITLNAMVYTPGRKQAVRGVPL